MGFKKKYLGLLLIFIPILLGLYSYKNILPYYFSPQWQPTEYNLNTSGKYDHQDEIGIFLGKQVRSHEVLDLPSVQLAVLGDSPNKRIEVDLTNQRVYAYEGETLVGNFLVSTGKWGRTPTGTFNITYKTRAQTMKGGSKELGTYYYLPNVQFVQFFGNKNIPWSKGFSFHGTYWHNNFGYPMSHGCINMKNEDAAWLYYWAAPAPLEKGFIKATEENPGTTVMIYGETPPS